MRLTTWRHDGAVGIRPKHNRPTNHHDRVVVYVCAYENEVNAPLAELLEAARADAAKHDANVVAEVSETIRRQVPMLRRTGLASAIRKVRGLGRRGVLLLGAPSQVGPIIDLAVVIALVEDAGGGVASIQPLTRDRAEHFQLIDLVDCMKRFAEEREKLRRCDDVFALRRTMSWPLDPGAAKDG